MRFSFFEPSGWLTADRKRRPPTKFTIVHNIYCMWSAIKPHHHWWSTKRNLFITENFCILIQKNIEIKSDTQPYNFISIPCPGIVQSAVWKCRVHSAQRNVNYAITNLIITNWMSNKYSISSSYFFFFWIICGASETKQKSYSTTNTHSLLHYVFVYFCHMSSMSAQY